MKLDSKTLYLVVNEQVVDTIQGAYEIIEQWNSENQAYEILVRYSYEQDGEQINGYSAGFNCTISDNDTVFNDLTILARKERIEKNIVELNKQKDVKVMLNQSTVEIQAQIDGLVAEYQTY